jgi:hypothetical protein
MQLVVRSTNAIVKTSRQDDGNVSLMLVRCQFAKTILAVRAR